MPKNKTHSGAKHRFKVTGSGKILHGRTFRQHLMTKKSGKKSRQLEGTRELSPASRPKVKRLLGI